MASLERPKPRRFSFDDVVVDLDQFCLLKQGEAKTLAPRAFDLLVYLIENGDRVIEKQELFEHVWKESFVTDNALTQTIKEVRRAIGDDADAPHYIMTIPKRGYRFIGAVSPMRDEPADLIVERHSIWRMALEEDGAPSEAVLDHQPTVQALPPGPLPAKWARSSIAAACIAIAIAGVGAYLFLSNRPKPPSSPSSVRSIAVLPFKPISPEGRDEYLELGMADALIARLSNINQIALKSTGSVRKFSGLEQDPLAAGRELNVESVLGGSVQRAGDRIRVTTRLVNVADGKALWTDSFDAKFTDVFAVQDSISSQIASALALTLSGGERKQLARRYTNNTEAYQLYLKGRYFWNKRTGDALKTSIEYFEQAIRADPNYALAYAGVADSYLLLGAGDYGVMSPAEAMPLAKNAATTALQLDETLAEAHTSLGFLNYIFDWDWAGADRHFRRAIELSPAYPTASHWYSLYLTVTGRTGEGIETARRARELDPLSRIINTDCGIVYFYARQYDRAVEQFKATLEMEPNFAAARWDLGRTYSQTGDYGSAISEIKAAMESAGRTPTFLGSLGYAYAVAGRKDEARMTLNELKSVAKRQYVFPHLIAIVYAGLGDKEEALDWLWRAFEERDNALVALKVEPDFDSLRSEPRFSELLRRVGLER
jgi:DNA-binding winged helix-turn-helix (wHTH) protein/TolB-like protein